EVASPDLCLAHVPGGVDLAVLERAIAIIVDTGAHGDATVRTVRAGRLVIDAHQRRGVRHAGRRAVDRSSARAGDEQRHEDGGRCEAARASGGHGGRTSATHVPGPTPRDRRMARRSAGRSVRAICAGRVQAGGRTPTICGSTRTWRRPRTTNPFVRWHTWVR